MAADSLSQISAGDDVHSLHQSVEKITEIRGRPIAVMINGLGEIEKRTIISLIREFEFRQYQLPTMPIRRCSVGELTSNLFAFLRDKYNATVSQSEDRPTLGVIVGGYTPEQFFPELYEIDFAADVVRNTVQAGAGSPERIKFWGRTAALERIYGGYDQSALSEALAVSRAQAQLAERGEDLKDLKEMSKERLTELLELMAQPPEEDAALMDRLQSLGNRMEMRHRLRGMPLQEAVEFADYLGQTAIGYDRFCQGNPTVGGKLDVVAIQPDGLHWYRRKPFLKKMARARQQTVDVSDRDQMRDMITEAFGQMTAQMQNQPELRKLMALMGATGSPTASEGAAHSEPY